MSRRRLGALPGPALALLGSLALAGPAGAGRGTGAQASPSQRLQVTQVEYKLLLSHATVKAGRVELTELDRGRERHDLRLSGPGGTINGRLLAPGGRWESAVNLRPGTYTLWCTLPKHYKLGMHTTLRVTR